MKRMIFGAALAMAVVSCGGEATDAVTDAASTINTEAVVEMENATNEVEAGLEQLENSVNELNTEVDSLLEGI